MLMIYSNMEKVQCLKSGQLLKDIKYGKQNNQRGNRENEERRMGFCIRDEKGNKE